MLASGRAGCFLKGFGQTNLGGFVMFCQELFNRVQVADILGYVSYHSVENLEKMGLIIPEVKPSKYSLSQVLFLLTCQHIRTYLKLTNKELLKSGFHIDIPVEKYKSSYLRIERESKQFTFSIIEDREYIQSVQNLHALLQDKISKILPCNCTALEDSSTFIIPRLGYKDRTETVLLPRILEILGTRCDELGIDLQEKITV